jgi:vacuolar iron transporter family protein
MVERESRLKRVSIIRVTFWGALAMGITAGVGVLFGTVV